MSTRSARAAAGHMHRRIAGLVFLCVCICSGSLRAQEFKLFDRTVQVHGFVSQGFVYTDQNNWLTMNTSQGSAAFTDFGLNMSAPVTDKLRIGAQVYDQNLGQLGQYHPSLDWAVADYRFSSWFGVRGGKVKTTLGLYNDTQDLDFLHTFALLPQSIYPADLRDATIAHLGGDVYGIISLNHRLGTLSYTAYAGHRSDNMYGGEAYLVSAFDAHFLSGGGFQYGGDLRWRTPLQGLLIGASRISGNLGTKGTFTNPFDPSSAPIPYSEVSKADWTNQFYCQYTAGKLRIDSEYRRYVHDEVTNHGIVETLTDVRGWVCRRSLQTCETPGSGLLLLALHDHQRRLRPTRCLGHQSD